MRSKLTLILIVFCSLLQAQNIKVSTGKVQRFENFESKFIDARNVDVWLPNGYNTNEKYAVLYMHDGQMLFDAETTWNKQAWEVDEVAGKLNIEGKVKKFIVVGIWNIAAKRHPEYFPQKPYERLSKVQKDSITAQLQKAGRTTDVFKPYSDSYLKFIVTELKPFIDKTFSTQTDKDNTFIAGSSMGGLISMYAICEYPEVFGAAACISTHWPGIFAVENNPIPEAFYAYLRKKLPNPKTNRIYFDYGDQTLDALYPPLQKSADAVMKEKGFTTENWVTKFFPGKNHSEEAWAERLQIPLEFLLQK
ncbi:alpha/beta hydrolase [Flavobacterium sp. J49]|uniref:alpha/beta hydrolase n=1 Tax=Flavobacterium sp. J49 TaxID=2718534 RepID=UPI0015935677|nr:alpha/beta hydrolase-fold protein [Flavobacterium sp. J49]MBF6639929.1 alpha/beta hydrolase [Flavobacterium sp. J49]NIC01174.1 alpha/beta hydrolase [Flavobacterium sp. J49]